MKTDEFDFNVKSSCMKLLRLAKKMHPRVKKWTFEILVWGDNTKSVSLFHTVNKKRKTFLRYTYNFKNGEIEYVEEFYRKYHVETKFLKRIVYTTKK